MKKHKLCCVFNTPSLYRENIYTRIDREYDCEWFFEDTDNQLATFDTEQLTKVSFFKTLTIGPVYWVRGLLSLLFDDRFDQYLMMGHSRNLSTLFFVVLKRLFYPHKKVYLWTHGFYGKESRLEYFLKRLLQGSADGLLLYGNYAHDLMLSYGFPKEKLFVIHNSLDYQKQFYYRTGIRQSSIYRNYFGNDDPVLIYLGRLLQNKQLDMLVQSLADLVHEGTPCNLVLVGEGPESDNLCKKVLENAIGSRVWFYGASYNEENNAALLYNATLCVAPGNVGLTAIHAMMFGCPVITHDCFPMQMPEFEAISKGSTGDFYEYGSQESLTETISHWLRKKPVFRESIRQNCYRTIDEEWNPDFQMKVLNQVLH